MNFNLTLIAQAITFAVLILVIVKFVWPPLLNAIEARQKEIADGLAAAKREAMSSFGDDTMLVEKYLTQPRHVEIQVFCDQHGNGVYLAERDCSVQRNNQKIIEESGSTMLPKNLEDKVYDYAEKLANAVNYFGAGTVEFIYNLDANDVYFMEMNTRLQVEHPVTELVTNTDIMGLQFKIASGESISNITYKPKGYAMELRINAEKATLQNDEIQFIPNAGKITRFELPNEKHIQILKSIDSGKEVTPFYDSMVVQVICYGKDRNDTINKLKAFLDKTVIQGVSTNIPLLKRILNDDVFINGDYDTGYLPKFLNRIDKQALIKDIATSAGDDKESVTLDLASGAGKAALSALLAKADVLIQNLKPGALARLGFATDRLAVDFPRLITCSISGYGDGGPMADRKAYDLLIQAESGLCSITGGPSEAARVGMSIVDVATGATAYSAILEALIRRGITGKGAQISVSMFDVMAEWLTVPLLNHEGGKSPERVGLAHPSIAPYGVFQPKSGAPILISIQSDREWIKLCADFIGDAELGTDQRFATNVARVANRSETDAIVAGAFGRYDAQNAIVT